MLAHTQFVTFLIVPIIGHKILEFFRFYIIMTYVSTCILPFKVKYIIKFKLSFNSTRFKILDNFLMLPNSYLSLNKFKLSRTQVWVGIAVAALNIWPMCTMLLLLPHKVLTHMHFLSSSTCIVLLS